MRQQDGVWLLLLMVTVFPFEFSPYFYISKSFLGIIPDFTVIKLLGMLGFVWASFKFVVRDSGPPMFDSLQAKLFAALFVGILISAWLNDSSIIGITKYLAFILFMPFVLFTVRTHTDLRRVVYVLALTMVFVFPYAIRQAGRYGGRMGVGLYEPNYFAADLVLLTPLAFAIAGYQTNRHRRMLWIGAGLVMLMAIFLTSSRGGFLGLLVAAMVYAYRRTGVRGAVAIVLLLIVVVLPTSLGQRALGTFDRDAPAPPGVEESNRAHTALFWGGLRMVADAPIFGVGPQRFKDFSRYYSGLHASYIAHNTYLEIAAEAGLPVLVIFLLMVAATIAALGRTAKLGGEGPEARELAAWAEGLRTGMIGFLVSAAFISAQYEKFFWMTMFVAIVIGRRARQHASARAVEVECEIPREGALAPAEARRH